MLPYWTAGTCTVHVARHRLSYAAPRCLTRRSVGASAEIENAPRSHVFLEILVAMGSACAIVVCPLCLLFFDCEL